MDMRYRDTAFGEVPNAGDIPASRGAELLQMGLEQLPQGRDSRQATHRPYY